MIAFHGVGKTFRRLVGAPVRALEDVTLEVPPGEVLGIAGPNGAGKSTLINLLLGFTRPSAGDVRLDGLPPRAFVEREGIGYLSELVAIPPLWRAAAALRRYAILDGLVGDEAAAAVARGLARLGLDEHRTKRVRQLSKGNAQRLALAQALAGERRILVLDEPTHGLDPVWTQRFRALVHELRAPDRVIVIASHNLDELQRVADRVVILDRGRIQRIVALRGGDVAQGGAWRIRVVAGADLVAAAFAEATVHGDTEVHVQAADVAALNRGLAQAIAAGALVPGVGPAADGLEAEFRRAVGAAP
jgi:ABC-type multidrug transport system ATPase subunit